MPYSGGVAEWTKAAVLKTAVPQGTGGSNPSPSASDERRTTWSGARRWPHTSRPGVWGKLSHTKRAQGAREVSDGQEEEGKTAGQAD